MGQPFTIQFARMIGRGEFDRAIAYLRSDLKNDVTDLSSLEMLAHCHHWAGQIDDAIASCRLALDYDPNSFDMNALLAHLLSDKGDHEDAAGHAIRGLENYPAPSPEIPDFLLSTYSVLVYFVPRLRDVSPDAAREQIEIERANWFEWAKKYLQWYGSVFGRKVSSTEH